jgi:hypothetical protein
MLSLKWKQNNGNSTIQSHISDKYDKNHPIFTACEHSPHVDGPNLICLHTCNLLLERSLIGSDSVFVDYMSLLAMEETKSLRHY